MVDTLNEDERDVDVEKLDSVHIAGVLTILRPPVVSQHIHRAIQAALQGPGPWTIARFSSRCLNMGISTSLDASEFCWHVHAFSDAGTGGALGAVWEGKSLHLAGVLGGDREWTYLEGHVAATPAECDLPPIGISMSWRCIDDSGRGASSIIGLVIVPLAYIVSFDCRRRPRSSLIGTAPEAYMDRTDGESSCDQV